MRSLIFALAVEQNNALPDMSLIHTLKELQNRIVAEGITEDNRRETEQKAVRRILLGRESSVSPSKTSHFPINYGTIVREMTDMDEWGKDTRREVDLTDIDALVPKDHLLRKIEKVMDYGWIYERLDPYYKHEGRLPVDSVVIIKMVLLQHLYGIPSLHRTYAEIDVNVAYRWFLGYNVVDGFFRICSKISSVSDAGNLLQKA